MPNATQLVQIGQAQLGIPWPRCNGRIRVRGNMLDLVQYTGGDQIALVGLGEGEWDGIDRYWVNKKLIDHTDTSLCHFHPGIDGVLGHGLAPDSNGGDQKVDNFFSYISSGVPRTTFDRLAYVALYIPFDSGAATNGLDLMGDFRTRKVRIFDNTGTQTDYAFTTNFAWIILDDLIQYLLKREALINENLTTDEKARIGFQSFVDAAAWYDEVLANGRKRFECNVATPLQGFLSNRIQQLLTMCQSYLLAPSGVINLYADKPRTPSFVLMPSHIKSMSREPNKKNLRSSANHWQGNFNNLTIPIAATVTPTGAARVSGTVTITTVAAHAFAVGDYVVIDNMDDASFNGTFKLVTVPDNTHFTYAQAVANATSGHGLIGMNESRYLVDSRPADHDQHQFTIGPRGLGLSYQPVQVPLQLDLGNNTADAVDRLLYFQKNRSLGMDQTPYIAPFTFTLKANLDAVGINPQDGSDKALMDVVPGELITVHELTSEEFKGDYEFVEANLIPFAGPPSGDGDQGMAELTLLGYVPTAFTDTSSAPPLIYGADGSVIAL